MDGAGLAGNSCIYCKQCAVGYPRAFFFARLLRLRSATGESGSSATGESGSSATGESGSSATGDGESGNSATGEGGNLTTGEGGY